MCLRFLLSGTFSIKLVLVRDYAYSKARKYLNHDFHSNTTLSHSRFRYFTVDFLYFFFKEVETPRFFLSELAGYKLGFW